MCYHLGMLFNSLPFFIFFPIVVCVTFVIPARLRQYWLLIASYFFYMSWNARYALLLFGCTIVTYVMGLLIDKSRKNVGSQNSTDPSDHEHTSPVSNLVFLIIGLFIVFSVLFVFKYLDFSIGLVESVCNLMGNPVTLQKYSLILPVGISFFTFQSAGYLIDVYRGDIYAEKSLPRYMLFISFFPQLVAGPIERSKNLLKQLDKTYDFDYGRVRNGLLIMLWGYFLKYCIADTTAVWANAVFNADPASCGALTLVLGAIAFTIQIYGDFMGYSTIARGAALVLGYNLINNFRQPYFATSIADFWRRWHISLSTWFRDYLYIPLGGSRCSKPRKYLNIMITFLVSGLWHGANLTFILWGGIHGLYQLIEGLLPGIFAPKEGAVVRNTLLRIKTFIAAAFAWIFFRAESMTDAFDYVRGFIGAKPVFQYLPDIYAGLYSARLAVIPVISLIVLVTASVIRERGIPIKSIFEARPKWQKFVICQAFVVMITLSLSAAQKVFIYFQF